MAAFSRQWEKRQVWGRNTNMGATVTERGLNNYLCSLRWAWTFAGCRPRLCKARSGTTLQTVVTVRRSDRLWGVCEYAQRRQIATHDITNSFNTTTNNVVNRATCWCCAGNQPRPPDWTGWFGGTQGLARLPEQFKIDARSTNKNAYVQSRRKPASIRLTRTVNGLKERTGEAQLCSERYSTSSTGRREIASLSYTVGTVLH